MSKDKSLNSLLQIHLAVFLFGSAGLFGKFLNFPSTIIVLGRVVFATIALLALLLVKKQKISLNSNRDYLLLSISGIILAIHWTTFFQSIQVSSVAIGLISFATFPVFVTFLEPYFLKSKLKGADLLIAFATVVGAALVVPSFDLGNSVTQGVVWGLLSAFTFALLSVFNKKNVKTYSSLVIAFYQDLVVAIVLLPFFFFVSPVIKSVDIFWLLILGVIFTALSHTLFIQGMAKVKAQTASIIASLEPIYGIVFAALLLSEFPSVRTLIGGAIILGAITYSSIFAKHSDEAIPVSEV